MIRSIKKFLVIALITYPFQICADSFSLSGRDIGIGLSGLAAGIIGTAVAASYYHPAALEKLKFEQEQAEKKKRELVEQIQKEQLNAIELQKVRAENLILQIQHTYGDEFEKLRKEKLTEKDALLTIIKENCGMKDMPLNQYYAQLVQNLEALKIAENILTAEKQQERLRVLGNLERILKVYNSLIAEKAKIEKDAAENRRKNEESEQRKVEKEQLELHVLRLRADAIKTKQQKLTSIIEKTDAVYNKLTADSIRNAEHSNELIGVVNVLRVSQAQHAQEFIQAIKKNHERTETLFAGLFRLIDQARQYVNHLVGQQQQTPISQPPPPYSPEYVKQIQAQQALPAPSAPPMN